MPKRAAQPVVLLVEDEPLILRVASLVLYSDGYSVLTAENGEEALEISRTFSGTIDALVADVRMPKMGGIELRERIISERPGIKVLFTSAYVGETPVKGCSFLRKPFQTSALRQRVRELLDLPVAA